MIPSHTTRHRPKEETRHQVTLLVKSKFLFTESFMGWSFVVEAPFKLFVDAVELKGEGLVCLDLLFVH
jgi:hypothetical protein